MNHGRPATQGKRPDAPPLGCVESVGIAWWCDAGEKTADGPTVAVARGGWGGPTNDHLAREGNAATVQSPALDAHGRAIDAGGIFFRLFGQDTGHARLARLIRDVGSPAESGVVAPLPGVGQAESGCDGDAERHGAKAPQGQGESGEETNKKNAHIGPEKFGEQNTGDGREGEAGQGKAG